MAGMTLTLHYHPLASFCWKPLVALYERGIAFEPVVVDLAAPADRAAFAAVWPFLKFPVLVDDARGATVAESSTIIDFLDAFHAGGMVPADPDRAWRARMWDRVFDSYVQIPMQKVVLDALRPPEGRDPTASPRRAPRSATPGATSPRPSPRTRGRSAPTSPSPTAPRRRRCSTAASSSPSAPTTRCSAPTSAG